MDTIDGKVLVLGATGKVGQNVVKELRAREIPVRVLVRSLDSVSSGEGDNRISPPTDFFTDKHGRMPLLVSGTGIEVVQGDIIDERAVCRATEGVSAVIDVHGVAPIRFSRFSDIWRDPKADASHPAMVNFVGVQNVVAACKKHNVKHLVRLTGLTVAMSASSPLVMLFNALMSFTVKWHRRSEMLIRESGLTYTVIQPSGLKETSKAVDTGGTLLLECEATSAKTSLPPPTGISRQDVASLCVEALCCKACKNATLRCVSLPKGKAVPSGLKSSLEWTALLEGVTADNSSLSDQNYVAYSILGVGVLASVVTGMLIGAGKLVVLSAGTLLSMVSR